MNLIAVEKHRGSGARLLGLNLGSPTYYLYELETNDLTSLSLCEMGLLINTKVTVSTESDVCKLLSSEPDTIVGIC